MSRVGGSVELEGTILLKLYLNEVVGQGPEPRRHGGAVIGTVLPRQGNTRGWLLCGPCHQGKEIKNSACWG
jgi:hypothetical protein